MFLLKKLKQTCFVLVITQAIILASAQAATITVNNTGDVDGDDQVCTLREAISSLHALTTIPTGCSHTGLYGIEDTIQFDPGLINQVIKLDQGLPLDISIDLVINGLGIGQLTIDGGANTPWGIFVIQTKPDAIMTTTVSINKLKISGAINSSRPGGGIFVSAATLYLTDCAVHDNTANSGGGIFALDSNITLNNSSIKNNIADNDGGGISAFNTSLNIENRSIVFNNAANLGAGIYMFDSSRAVLGDSTVARNIADSDGGGIYVSGSAVYLDRSFVNANQSGSDGGGIYSSGGSFVSLGDDTSVLGNRASVFGGGISVDSSSAYMSGSTVSRNFAISDGGGFYVTGESDVIILGSTVSSNETKGLGGGIMSQLSSVGIAISTISSNKAKSGGGILFSGINPDLELSIHQSTITNNLADEHGGGIFLDREGSIAKLAGSIFSGNNATISGEELMGLGGTYLANDANLFGESSNSTAEAFSGFSPDPLGTDIIATSDGPMPTALTSILNSTLTNNGGATDTHALVTGSPAINAGNETCYSVDQRGVSRSDGECDIGSYEYTPLIFSDSFE